MKSNILELLKRSGIGILFLASLLIVAYLLKNNLATRHEPIPVQNIVRKDTTISEIDFVFVGQGPFHFGARDSIIQVDYDYWIMKYEVTNRQYYDFLMSTLGLGKGFIDNQKFYYRWNHSEFYPDTLIFIKILDSAIYVHNDKLVLNQNLENHPVTQINWFGCVAFCLHHNFSLPSRYEWEKAARGLTGWYFPWGNEIDSTYANYYGSNHPYKGRTTPVGYFDGSIRAGFQTNDNSSIYGAYDMLGNAYEYTAEFLCAPVGGGGGYHYHTPAMAAPHVQNCFGLPLPLDIQRCDTADGFRAVFKN